MTKTLIAIGRSNNYLLFCLLMLSMACSLTGVTMPLFRYIAGIATGVQIGVILWRRPSLLAVRRRGE